MQLRLTTDAQDRHTVIHLAGELDVASRSAVDDALLDALQDTPDILVIELSELTFIDSTGLGALVAGQRAARSRGVRLVLAAPGEAVLRTLHLVGLVGLDEPLPLYDTVEEALRQA